MDGLCAQWFSIKGGGSCGRPGEYGTADDRRKSFCHLMYHDTYDALGSLPGCQVTSRDEVDWHTLEGVRALREAFATNNPNGRLTWGFTMNALEDGRKNYREIRDYVVECQKKYGDEVTYFPVIFRRCICPVSG